MVLFKSTYTVTSQSLATEARLQLNTLLPNQDTAACQQVAVPSGRKTQAGFSRLACPFDLDCLLDRCLGDATFCTMLLRKFADRAADQLAALERAAGSSNKVELAAQAHRFMEIAANLSADDLRAATAEVEQLARADRLDRVFRALEQVRGEVARCIEAMPLVLAQIAPQL